MAFGIDDTLLTAAAGIRLSDTLVTTISAYRKKKKAPDVERLFEEVRLAAIDKVDEADLKLTKFERWLAECGVDLDKRLIHIIKETSFWEPVQQYRLSQMRKWFHNLSDGLYCSIDDVAALLRCQGETGEMGAAVVRSAEEKHKLSKGLLEAESLRAAIALLRHQLKRHKEALA